jgi:heat shock protein HtpX
MIRTTDQSCPRCGAGLVAATTGEPWCPSCEWNLNAFDRQLFPLRGWSMFEARGHQLAFAADRALIADMLRDPRAPSRWTRSRVVLVAISALLVLAEVVGAAFAIYVIVRHSSFLAVVGAVALLLVILLIRPRLGRPPKRADCVIPSAAPTLFGLVARVCAAINAPPPDRIVLTREYNAAVSRDGLRGVVTLRIGARMWLALTPQQRIAMIAHEMGHVVSRDPGRGLLVEPVLTTFFRLATVTGTRNRLRSIWWFNVSRLNIVGLFIEIARWLVSRVFVLAHLAVRRIALPDRLRAEYRADVLAADVGGSDAALAVIDRLVLGDQVIPLLSHVAGHRPPDEWAFAVDSLIERRAGILPYLRQDTARATSLWDSHPPSGRRAELLLALPSVPPTVTIDDGDIETLNWELSRWTNGFRADLVGMREVVERRKAPPVL